MQLETRKMLLGSNLVSLLMQLYLSSQKEEHLRSKEGQGDMVQK